jgi:hypothetical protein
MSQLAIGCLLCCSLLGLTGGCQSAPNAATSKPVESAPGAPQPRAAPSAAASASPAPGSGATGPAAETEAAPGASNSPICDTLARPSLRVKVLDAQSGQAICDAEVEAQRTDSGKRTELSQQRGRTPALCAYHSMQAGAGQHRVLATKPGYVSASEVVQLVQERCFVTGPVVTLRLKRAGASTPP